MCGIAGIFATQGQRENVLGARVSTMVHALHHRGPDGSGVWVDPAAALGLGHARLAIIDLAPSGSQPMVSVSQRFVIVFNGEIYNYQDIRRRIEAVSQPVWRGTSDTEVLLAAIELWGLEATLEMINGMFAFAVYDRQTRQLTLARDRLGEKPLYYGFSEGMFVFASELKAIRPVLKAAPAISQHAAQLFFRYGYVPAPYTIYKDFFKLPAGHRLTLSLDEFEPQQAPQPYWSARDFSEGSKPYPTMDQAANTLEALLTEVVQQQAISDVPLGCFLSGGVDSSLVAALLQKGMPQRLKTFSIGFADQAHDEAPFAKNVAEHIGTDHTEFYVTDREARDVIPALAHIYDEPFADSSQIPTFLVSKLARQFVTVALSGDGADELFGGYGRYQLMQTLINVGRLISPAVAKNIHSLLSLPVVPQTRFVRRARGLCESLSMPLSEAFTRHVSIWREVPVTADHPYNNSLQATLLHDLNMYLPDDIMVKVDRASMANSLETRAPFMDRRIAEFALQLPMSLKIAQGQGKRILKHILYKHVPQSLVDRPKMGFGVPLSQWLKGPLRAWAQDLISSFQRHNGHILPAELVQKYWHEHQTGGDEQHYRLWCVLMYQSWHEAAYQS